MAMKHPRVPVHLDGPDGAAFAHLFHALCDPTRLAIVQHLTLGEHRVRDLVEHLGLAQSTVSAHLARLRDCGLVAMRPEGRATVVALREPAALNSLLDGATRFLAATGQMRSCDHLDEPQGVH